MANIKPDNLSKAIAAELNKYTDAVTDKVRAAVHEVTKDTVKDLRASSPKRTGKYAKSWTSDYVVNKMAMTQEVVHAKKPYYRLTHLLEYGHAKKNGGRVPAQPHIKPAEDKAIAKLEKLVTEAIENS